MSHKPFIVLFDANPLAVSHKSGVGYYTKYLIQALAAVGSSDVQLIGHYFNFLGRKKLRDLPTAANIKYVQSKIIPGKLLSITRKIGFQLPLELFFKHRGDVALFTNFVSLPSWSMMPRAVVVHDLSFIDMPQYVIKPNRQFLKFFVPRSIRSAKLVLTISEVTKQAIINKYKTPEGKLLITHIPPGPKIGTQGVDIAKMGVTGKFILFNGNLEPRKNLLNLTKAYSLLPDELKRQYQLVLGGGMGWYFEKTQDYISSLQKQGEQIVITGYLTDEALAALRQQASLLVQPSLYEGFGMPILEAASYDLPVAASDIPVFHEVAGNAAAFFDKDSPEDMAKTIAKVLTDIALQANLITNGRKNLERFSWPKIAKITLEALKNIAE